MFGYVIHSLPRIQIKPSPCSFVAFPIPITAAFNMIARTDTNTTLLDQLLALGLKVDLDSCDVAFARTLPFRPADMTSNQAIIAEAILDPTNKETVEAIVRSLPGMEPFDVFTILVSLRALGICGLVAYCLACQICQGDPATHHRPRPGPNDPEQAARPGGYHCTRAGVCQGLQRRGYFQVRKVERGLGADRQ